MELYGKLFIEWAFLFLILTGIGALAFRLWEGGEFLARHPLAAFWGGLCGLLFLLQIWHLFWPVDTRAFTLATGLGVAGILIEMRDRKLFPVRITPGQLAVFLVFIPFLFWAGYRSLLPACISDTGLYHIQAVQWNGTYKIVPGLANLHTRFGFHSTFFLYCAFLEPQFFFKSYHVANGLFWAVMFFQVLSVMARLVSLGFRRDGQARLRHSDLFLSLFFLPILYRGFSILLSSSSPDLLVFILQILCAYYFLLFLEEGGSSAESSRSYVQFLAWLCLAGLTLKMSFIVFGVVLFLIVLVRHCSLFPWRTLLGAGGPVGSILLGLGLVPWMLSQGILSGYLFFPSAVVTFPVPWKVPEANAQDHLKALGGWAKQPFVHYSQVIGSWDWLAPWFRRMVNEFFLFVWPSVLAGLALSGVALTRLLVQRRPDKPIGLLLVPSAVALVSWFFSAPDIRFAGANFFILAMGGWVLLFSYWDKQALFGRLVLYFNLLLLMLASPVMLEQATRILHPQFTQNAFHQSEHVLYTYITDSGLKINVPRKGDKCWDAPLPCTPYPVSDLHLRREGDLGSGFISRMENLMK